MVDTANPRYDPVMSVVHARVHHGQLHLDEPTTLTEGTVLRLVPDDPSDELDDPDRAALHAALLRSEDDFRSSTGISAAALLAELDAAGR